MDSIVLSLKNVVREIPEKRIVDDVSFDVMAGETLAIIGPSGSGKSSLLRLINRLDERTGGVIVFNNREINTYPPSELRRHIGMVMQMAYLFPGTVAENVQYGPLQRKERLSMERVEELLATVGLRGYSFRDVSNLSGGEAQRVSIARTLANSPEMLLLDEPTSALDEKAKLEVEIALRSAIAQHALTCVMVTHDVAQARRMAARCLVLEGGRVTRLGLVAEMLPV